MVAWMVARISWRLLGTMAMGMPRAQKMTPRKMASDLQILRHKSAHCCCAKLCLSKISPVPNFPLPGTHTLPPPPSTLTLLKERNPLCPMAIGKPTAGGTSLNRQIAADPPSSAGNQPPYRGPYVSTAHARRCERRATSQSHGAHDCVRHGGRNTHGALSWRRYNDCCRMSSVSRCRNVQPNGSQMITIFVGQTSQNL